MQVKACHDPQPCRCMLSRPVLTALCRFATSLRCEKIERLGCPFVVKGFSVKRHSHNLFERGLGSGQGCFALNLGRAGYTTPAAYPHDTGGGNGGSRSGPKPSLDLLEALVKKGVELENMDRMVVGKQHNGLICPFCDGGTSKDTSFSIIFDNEDTAMWNCFRGKCGARGRHNMAGNILINFMRKSTICRPSSKVVWQQAIIYRQ